MSKNNYREYSTTGIQGVTAEQKVEYWRGKLETSEQNSEFIFKNLDLANYASEFVKISISNENFDFVTFSKYNSIEKYKVIMVAVGSLDYYCWDGTISIDQKDEAFKKIASVAVEFPECYSYYCNEGLLYSFPEYIGGLDAANLEKSFVFNYLIDTIVDSSASIITRAIKNSGFGSEEYDKELLKLNFNSFTYKIHEKVLNSVKERCALDRLDVEKIMPKLCADFTKAFCSLPVNGDEPFEQKVLGLTYFAAEENGITLHFNNGEWNEYCNAVRNVIGHCDDC